MGMLSLELSVVAPSPFAVLVSQLELDSHPVRRERLEVFLEGVADAAELVCVEIRPDPALGAGGMQVLVEPSERFAEFVRALLAGERDGNGVDVDGHSVSPDVRGE